jgi:hypothetical protein
MKVAALIDDLFFTSKLQAVAKEVGTEVVFCRSADAVPPDSDRILVDLNASTFDSTAEIGQLKARQATPITAFVSHVQVDLKTRAENAGANEVLPRSVFTLRLAEILRG